MANVNEQMQHDLREVLDEAHSGAMTSAAFRDALESIYRRHLGEDAELPGNIEARREASELYDDRLGTIERHHQLERVGRALGLEPEPGGASSRRH
jgi:hypothetical protein